MNIIFVSMNDYGKSCLEEFISKKIKIAAVFTLKEEYAEGVSDFVSFDGICEKNNISLYKIKNINDHENIEMIKKIAPDFIFVLGWSQIIKEELLKIPKKGCLGTHPTLLPKNRGRAAIPWMILNHEKETAVTMFYMNEGVDAGDIVAQERFKIDDDETAEILYKKVVLAGRKLIRENIESVLDGKAKRIKQNEKEATYLSKRIPEDGLIDWNKPTKKIYDLIRATTHPYPGAFTYYLGKKLIIWKASLFKCDDYSSIPGQIIKILENGVLVMAGDGTILIERVQIEGEKEVDAIELFKRVDQKLGMNVYEEIEKLNLKLKRLEDMLEKKGERENRS